MHVLNTIASDLASASGQNCYSLNDDKQTFTTPNGQVVTLFEGKLAELTTSKPDDAAHQVYQYFKFIRDRSVQPPPTANPARPDAEQRKKIIIDCIASAFTKSLKPTTFEVLSDRICNDYRFFHRNESSRYPEDMAQLSTSALKDFVHMILDGWKYEITSRIQRESLEVMEDFDSSLVEFIYSTRPEAQIQELSLQKMLNPGKLQKVSGPLYRGGSNHELDKVKRLKFGKPCFDIHFVNHSKAIYGRGLYVSPSCFKAASFASMNSPGRFGGVMLEIKVNDDCCLMQFHDPYPDSTRSGHSKTGAGSHRNFIPSLNPLPSTISPPTPNFFSHNPNFFSHNPNFFSHIPNFFSHNPNLFSQTPNFFSHTPGLFSQNAIPAVELTPTALTPNPFSVQPTPASVTGTVPGKQQLPNDNRSTFQTNIVPTINDTPHPLVGSIKCQDDVSVIVNPRFIKQVRAFDKELRTKVDLKFTAQDIVMHKMVPKFVSQALQVEEGGVAQLTDPLTGQNSNATISQVQVKLPPALTCQRNQGVEVKFYTSIRPDLWLRVKPAIGPSRGELVSNIPFVITYTMS